MWAVMRVAAFVGLLVALWTIGGPDLTGREPHTILAGR